MDSQFSGDTQLALKCYILNELAEGARKLLRDDLEKIVEEKNLYRFVDRLKGQEGIQNKVLRKRDEIFANK